jgi:hypothetical protein
VFSTSFGGRVIVQVIIIMPRKVYHVANVKRFAPFSAEEVPDPLLS